MKKIYEYTDYFELLKDLKVKYGIPKQSYFTNDVNYGARPSIKRSNEGLFVHHDREDTYIMISTKEMNIKHNYPFEVHEPENLTYCNYMEHLMLHVLIACNKEVINKELKQALGIGGVVNFFVPQINTYLSKAYEFKQEWLLKSLSVFDEDEGYETYIKCLQYLIKNINKDIGLVAHEEYLVKELTKFDIRVLYDRNKASHFKEIMEFDLLDF